MAIIAKAADKIPKYLIAGIGNRKNQSPQSIVKEEITMINQVGMLYIPLIIKHNGPDMSIANNIIDENKAKVIIGHRNHHPLMILSILHFLESTPHLIHSPLLLQYHLYQRFPQ